MYQFKYLIYMNFKKLAFCLLLLTTTGFGVFAQTGILKGKVIDSESAEELLGTNVYLTEDVLKGTITDLFGDFQMELPVGTYSVSTSFIGYHTMATENVEVKEGEITEVLIQLAPSTKTLIEVDITVKVDKSNEIAVISERKNSPVMMDGVGAQEIANSGASDAGQAVKSVPGTSVEDGKYMVVRGLGDRYSITQLNGVTLPSTDPYRNSASLDLIPSFMLDNIMTSKTFSPDQPGNFTGGNLNIKTKSYPEKFFLNFGVSTSYNTLSSFRNDFLTADGGRKDLPDFLADPDAQAKMSTDGYGDARLNALRNGDVSDLEFLNQTVQDLNTPLMPTTTSSLMDYGVGFSVGDMHLVKGKNPFGYVFGVKYKKGYDYYDNGTFNRWQAQKDGMLFKFDMSDEQGTISDNLGSYLSFSYLFAKNHEIVLSGLYNNDASVFGREQFGTTEQLGNSNYYRARSSGEKQRNMANVQLRGTHVFPALRGGKLEWVSGITHSSQLEPDLRFFSDHVAFAFDDKEGNEEVRIDQSSYGLPNHFYRRLDDVNIDFKIDYKQPLGTSGNHLKVGGLVSMKDRNFNEYRVKAVREPLPVQSSDTDWAEYLSNFGIDTEAPYTAHNYFINDTRPSNQYSGSENVMAAYGMLVMNLTKNLKAVGGVRMETTDIEVISEDPSIPIGSIESVDFLPSLNMVYELTKNSNLRFAVSQTLARPNMREMAPFESFDFLGGFLYSGNENLERTLIRNVDLRWENYRPNGEMLAVSVYYKSFLNPIVKVFSPVSSTGEITYDNLDQAVVYGAEVEWRKSLDFISGSLKNFKLATNLSLIYSEVEIPEEDLESIQNNYLLMGTTRPFQGQSPFLINANLYYKHDSASVKSSLTFNVFGKRLYEIGSTGNPDIFEMPRPLLNYNISKTINNKIDLSFSVGNILNTKFLTQQFYKSENPQTQEVIEETYIVERRELGRTFSIGINYKIQ